MHGTILGDAYGIILGIDAGTEMGSFDQSFDGSNVGKIDGLFIGDSLGSTDGKVHGSDEGIKLVLFGGKMLGTILDNVDGIILTPPNIHPATMASTPDHVKPAQAAAVTDVTATLCITRAPMAGYPVQAATGSDLKLAIIKIIKRPI